MDKPVVEKLLEDAAHAIEELQKSNTSSRKASGWTILAVVLVVIVAAGMLGLHTFAEGGIKVDGTTGLLLAVLLFAPFVQHLKALEFGGAKAEFQANTENVMGLVLRIVTAEHGAIKGIVDGETVAQDEASAVTVQAAEVARPAPAARPLRKVLWVDSQLERSAYEQEALGKLFEVKATTPADARTALDGTIDAVVVAGADAGILVPALSPPLPIISYASPDVPIAQPEGLTKAEVVTSYTQLVTAMRQLAREQFDASVLSVFKNLRLTNVKQDPDGIDYLVVLDKEHTVAIETPHWLRPPKAESLRARYGKLADAVGSSVATSGLLVTQKPFPMPVDPPAKVESVTLDKLAGNLKALMG